MAEKQCVWIIRYGLTETPLVENLGPFDSDIHPNEGVDHANAIAQRIAAVTNGAPKVVFSSPFLRTTHTAHIIAKQVSAPVHIEEGLTEWLTPSLLVEPNGIQTKPRAVSELADKFDSIDTTYASINPISSDQPGAPHFVETEEALLKRCDTTISRLLAAIGESFAIVSHAPCDQAIALYLEGAPCLAESKLGPWPLGGVTMFSRENLNDEWTMELYGDTSHMPGPYAAGIKEWSLPCLSKASGGKH